MASKKIRQLQFDTRVSPGIEIIPVNERYVRTRENLLVPHRADFFCVLWFYSGQVVHLVDFEPVVLAAPGLLFVAKDRVQLFDQERAFEAKVLLFTEELFDTNFLQWNPLFNRPDGSVTRMVASEGLARHWEEMERELASPSDRFKPLLLRNHLENFLLQSEREAGIVYAGEGTDLFFALRRLMEKHYKDQQPVSFYTDALGVSGKVLARVTSGLTGKTPKQLLDERLLLEAKRLLIHGLAAGKEIGYELGFMEPTNFVKFFKKHTGVTPSVFRSGYLQG